MDYGLILLLSTIGSILLIGYTPPHNEWLMYQISMYQSYTTSISFFLNSNSGKHIICHMKTPYKGLEMCKAENALR